MANNRQSQSTNRKRKPQAPTVLPAPTYEQDLLGRASHEIKQLRSNNERMRLRLDMFDACQTMLGMRISYNAAGLGMSLDVSFEIDSHLKNVRG